MSEPSRSTPPPTDASPREEQILAAMPVTGGILFGIRIRLVPLAHLLDDRVLRAGLHRALATMPDALADYKGLGPIRGALIQRCVA